MNHIKRITIILICFAILALTGLACTFPVQLNEEDLLHLEQTKVALAITQTALAQPIPPTNTEVVQPTTEPTQPPTNTPEPSPTPQPTETTVTTQTIQPDFVFNGISFSFDDAIAAGVSAKVVPGAIDEYGFPGGTYPDYYELTFSDYALSDTFHQPTIRIYPVEAYKTMSEQASGIISLLEDALIEKPKAGFGVGLPFLPMWNAAMMFSASSSYFPFQNGEGVRYLTMFGQAAYPIDNTNLFYTYQGRTSDKAYYISAILPISNPALPMHGEDTIGDLEEFYDTFLDYLSTAIVALEAYPPESFTPTLKMLDDMMASFIITPTE